MFFLCFSRIQVFSCSFLPQNLKITSSRFAGGDHFTLPALLADGHGLGRALRCGRLGGQRVGGGHGAWGLTKGGGRLVFVLLWFVCVSSFYWVSWWVVLVNLTGWVGEGLGVCFVFACLKLVIGWGKLVWLGFFVLDAMCLFCGY